MCKNRCKGCEDRCKYGGPYRFVPAEPIDEAAHIRAHYPGERFDSWEEMRLDRRRRFDKAAGLST